MSAYVVDAFTIDNLIYFATENGLISDDQANDYGQMLLKENVKSVNYRYKTRDACPDYVYNPDDAVKTLYAAIESVNTLEYQSCEHKTWESSKAHKFLADIVSRARAQHACPFK